MAFAELDAAGASLTSYSTPAAVWFERFADAVYTAFKIETGGADVGVVIKGDRSRPLCTRGVTGRGPSSSSMPDLMIAANAVEFHARGKPSPRLREFLEKQLSAVPTTVKPVAPVAHTQLERLRSVVQYYLRRLIGAERLPTTPFSTFFLRPCSKGDFRSGAFGYEYHLVGADQEKAVREWCTSNSVQREALIVPKGMGLCSQVFRSGRAAGPEKLAAILSEYQIRHDLITKFERAVVFPSSDDGYELLEVPVYAGRLFSDPHVVGPELIVGIAAAKLSTDDTAGVICETLEQLVKIVLTPPLEAVDLGPQIRGAKDVLDDLRAQLRVPQRSDGPVLVLGETGVGKDLVAEAIHDGSPRKGKPFIPVNCAGIPDTLIESEMFGHKKGAFTGADKDRNGRIKEAEEGTLFLDEVGEMSLPLQTKLLRFLNDGRFMPVGGEAKDVVKADVRIIAATNQPLLRLIEKDRFRADLYHRIATHVVLVPSLASRGDVEHLVKSFFSELAEQNPVTKEIAPAVLECLCGRLWTGNIRELRAAVESLFHEANAAGSRRVDSHHYETWNRRKSHADAFLAGKSPRDQEERPAKEDTQTELEVEVGTGQDVQATGLVDQ